MDNAQKGPPGCGDLLADVVQTITYKPGWQITVGHMQRTGEHLAGGEGLTLRVTFTSDDSTGTQGSVALDHLFVVPPAAYNRETWERFVLDCLIQMETHEAMEWFKVDGHAPFFPPHGTANGSNPYTIVRR